MKSPLLLALLLSSYFVCFSQTAVTPDPTLNTTGVPAYLRMLPNPAPEPWHKITEEERFRHYAGLVFSPGAALGAVSGAAISQWMNSPEEWGQGWKPYGVRVASSYGSSFVGYTIMYGTSAAFHDDNRYFRSKKTSFGGRLGNVLISPYVAHNNSGNVRFSGSSFLGGVGGSTIPLLWSPGSWQGFDSVAINYSIWYGSLAGINLVREFFPSMVKHYKDKGNGSKSVAPPSPKK